MSPRHVGNYRLDYLLGSGGMGEVYKAYDTRRDRYVALKLLPGALSGDREYLTRFQRESHVVARLRDPHVIPIHDFGEIDGQLFIDMRLVDGTDVGALLQANGPIAPPRAANLVSQIAEALDAAHADHLVHRDIKPSNVLVTPSDFVYVVDFGIARSMGSRQTALTVTGATIGTLNYMAPERFASGDIDGRADVYSLACVLHECLTGAPPFNGEDFAALIYAHLYSRPQRASSLVAGIPPGLDDVIARGMAKDPRDRFPTAGTLAAAAREALLTEAPGPPVTEHLASGRGEIPASVWVSATEAWQAVAQPPESGAGPAVGRPAWGVDRSPTQTVKVANFDGSGLPPGAVTGSPAHGRRRPGPRTAAAAAAAVAVVVAIVLIASARPKTNEISSSASSAPAVAVPTVAKKLTVGQSPSYAQVAPNGKFAYVTNTGAQAITVLNTANDQVSGTIKIPQGPPQFVSFSGDSQTAYVSIYNTQGSVHLVAFIDTVTGQVTGTVPVNNHTPGPSAVSPNGEYLYVPNHNMSMLTGNDENAIDVIDTASRKLIDTISVAANPHWVVFGKNGFFYTSDHMSGTVTIINSHNNQVVKTFAVGETPHGVAVSPDGSRLAVSSFSGNEVFVVSTATDEVVATIRVGKNPLEITYSPDGRYLYAADNDSSTVTVIDTANNHVIAEVPAGKNPTSISVLPNGSQAYVTDEGDGTIEVLNLP